MSFDFDMTGNKCSLIKAKCPGRWIQKEGWGCPYWKETWVNVDESPKPVLWKGCSIMMDYELSLGMTKAVKEAANTVQGVRNVMARGFLGLTLAAGLDPTPVMAEFNKADEDTNKGRNSIEIKSNNG